MAMPKWLTFVIIFGLGSSSTKVAPAQERCTSNDEKRASNDVTRLRKQLSNPRLLWGTLHDSFRQFAKCDDGFIAEGYSDVVTKALAQSWPTVADLERILRGDTKFRAFILRHIDSTADQADLVALRNSATFDCKYCSRSLCKKVAERANDALAKY